MKQEHYFNKVTEMTDKEETGTAKEYCEVYADNCGFWNPEKACQAYIIGLGINDRRMIEMGSMDDIDFEDYHNNKETFADESLWVCVYGRYDRVLYRLYYSP